MANEYLTSSGLPAGVNLNNSLDANTVVWGSTPSTNVSGSSTINPSTGSAGTYDGTVQANKFLTISTGTGDGMEASEEATQAAGNPPGEYLTANMVNQLSNQIGNKPSVQTLANNFLNIAQHPELAAQDIPQLSAAAQAALLDTGVNIWALLVVALKTAMEDQNETLKYDLSRLKMYSIMSDQMSQYASILEDTQNTLDQKISNTKDNNAKQNVDTPMPTQYFYGPESFYTLNAAGQMMPQNKGTSSTVVNSQGLQQQLTIFTQQRDQLQKNIDHWTNQYQSDNEVKNQLTSTVTSILKNLYDMLSAVVRNLNL